jgi:hypothetical protein
MEQGYKIIAEPSHLALSMIKGVFKNPAFTTVEILFLVYNFPQSLLLSWGFSISSFSHTFLKEHNYESSYLVVYLSFLRALSEKDRHLVTLKHNV